MLSKTNYSGIRSVQSKEKSSCVLTCILKNIEHLYFLGCQGGSERAGLRARRLNLTNSKSKGLVSQAVGNFNFEKHIWVGKT